MKTSIAVVDSGPLYAAANRADPDYRRCLEVLESPRIRPVIPALCVAEVAYLLGRRAGTAVEASFLRGLEPLGVEAPKAADWAHIAELVERYENLPLGATDASVIVLAERLGTDLIVTLDRRHFGTVAGRGGTRFRLLPD